MNAIATINGRDVTFVPEETLVAIPEADGWQYFAREGHFEKKDIKQHGTALREARIAHLRRTVDRPWDNLPHFEQVGPVTRQDAMLQVALLEYPNVPRGVPMNKMAYRIDAYTGPREDQYGWIVQSNGVFWLYFTPMFTEEPKPKAETAPSKLSFMPSAQKLVREWKSRNEQ
jgi:hypothetical protein